MITDPDDFFVKGCGRCARFDTPDCSAAHWRAGLAALRQLCLEAGLEETAKWGHPCYMHAGRNIAILGAFRSDFRLSFFEAALLADPESNLERQGQNSQTADCLRFTEAPQVIVKAAAIRALLAQAMAHAEAGTRAPKAIAETPIPPELIEALDADPDLAEAFSRLTPGRQRSYALNLNAAKSSATRQARIAAFRPRILSGKGATER